MSNILNWFKKYLKNNKAKTYFEQGYKNYDLKQFDKAIEDFNKAIELNPNYALAYYNRGNAYSDLKQYDKAIEDYNKAIELDSNYALAYNNRGIAYGKLKEFDKAIEDFNKALELIENGEKIPFEKYEIYVELSKAYEELNQPEKEEEYLKKAKDLGYKEQE